MIPFAWVSAIVATCCLLAGFRKAQPTVSKWIKRTTGDYIRVGLGGGVSDGRTLRDGSQFYGVLAVDSGVGCGGRWGKYQQFPGPP